VQAWKRADRNPTPRSGLCADCREADPGYLDLVLGRDARPAPEYDAETAAWAHGYPEAFAERFDVPAIVAEHGERGAGAWRRETLAREVYNHERREREAARNAHVLHVAVEGTAAAAMVRR
jgi:hypothetical protein